MKNHIKIVNFLKKQKINYKNFNLYLEAFTHKTYQNENSNYKNYQRLEFLGDALIESFISEYIFKNYPLKNEGEMTLLRANVVNKKALSEFALDLAIDKIILFGNKIENLIDNKKILSDAFESFAAALYLDLGKKELWNFFKKNIFLNIKENSKKNLKNPKTIVQELLQGSSIDSIVYYETEKHDEINFKSKLIHENITYGIGYGKTKKEAEINSALHALKTYKE